MNQHERRSMDENPASSQQPSPRSVHVVRCADYADSLAPAFARLLGECRLLEPSAVRGRRVLVKPNMLTDRTPDKAVTTHPSLLRLVIRHLKSSGASVSVGDSPASAANLRNVLERTGIGGGAVRFFRAGGRVQHGGERIQLHHRAAGGGD